MSLTRTALRLAAACAVTAFILAFTAGCGRKGEIIPPGTVVPAPVTDLHAEPSSGQVLIAWTKPARNEDGTPLSDLAGFEVLRAELSDEEGECDCVYRQVGTVDLEAPGASVVRGGRIVWADPGESLEYDKRYGYAVRPFNQDGFRGSVSNTASLLFLPPPPMPEGLTAAPTDGTVMLEWQAVSVEAGIAGYNLYRAETPGGPMTRPLNRTPFAENSYTDTGLVNGKEYYYRVAALAGQSPPFSEGPATPEVGAVPLDNIAPEPPSALQAVPADGAALLSWLPSMDEDVAGYVLYRMGPGESALKPLPGMPLKGITYKDTDVESGMAYSYAVSAVDDAPTPNESVLSGTVKVVLPAAE